MNLDLFKFIIKFLKYYVVIGSIIMTIHCACLLFGYDLWIADILTGLSIGGFISLLLSSYLLKMCNLYRAFLLHQCIVSCCISYEDNIGFGQYLFPSLLFVFGFGLILILILIKNNGFKKDNCSVSQRFCREN